MITQERQMPFEFHVSVIHVFCTCFERHTSAEVLLKFEMS